MRNVARYFENPFDLNISKASSPLRNLETIPKKEGLRLLCCSSTYPTDYTVIFIASAAKFLFQLISAT
jgi:hypothetical protein